MTDEELERAMDDLGIEKQRRDASDVEVGTEPATAPAAASPSPADELAKLAELRNQGVLTDAEFEAQKQKILGL